MLKSWLFIVLLFPFLVSAENFVVNKDYEVINTTASQSSKKIKVIEFFSYGCPWCYRIEPTIEKWVKKNNDLIEFTRMPVIFNKDWVYYAKAYYTAELLNMNAKMSPLLFKAIQVDKKKLTTNQSMIDFFTTEGVNKAVAESAFTHSTTIDMKIAEGNEVMAQFHITGVPAFVINNHYKTDLQMAQSEERLVQILNYLITK